jgi:hypothetical protein
MYRLENPMNRSTIISSSLACTIIAIATACATEAPPPSKPDPSDRAAAREQTARERAARLPRIDPAQPADTPSEQTPLPPGRLSALKVDAAKIAQVPESGIELVSSERVTWNDGSLGCPAGNEVYTQMLVRGYRVVLRAGEQNLDYRLADSGAFRLCGVASEPVAPLPGAADR